MSERIAKVNKLLKQEVGKLILEDVDFAVGLVVTVIKADTSPDLHYGDIYISVMPKEREEEVLQNLEENVYALQQKINRKLFMKPVPMIRFRLDLSGDNADRINEIIRKNKEEED
ncbi:MAG: ribosome-binding factor A [Candidatus Paceibacterota bacterium]